MSSQGFSFSFRSLLALVFFHIAICTANYVLFVPELIYEFPIPTVLENLAVRHDGTILTTVADRAEIYLIQPSASTPDPQLIYSFDESNAVTGIVETSPDVFHVTVTSVTEDLAPIPNTSQLWSITFSSRAVPDVSKVADLPRISFPNGLTSLAGGERLLSADSYQGVVYIINAADGHVVAALFHSLFDPTHPGAFGVNGLKISGDNLYFTNTAQRIFGMIPIDPHTGITLGSAASINSEESPTGTYDDFALSPNGKVALLTTTTGNDLERINLKNGRQDIPTEESEESESESAIPHGPTSAAYGRKKNGKHDSGILFVTTSGGQLMRYHTVDGFR